MLTLKLLLLLEAENCNNEQPHASIHAEAGVMDIIFSKKYIENQYSEAWNRQNLLSSKNFCDTVMLNN
jgi:hypothetical protein